MLQKYRFVLQTLTTVLVLWFVGVIIASLSGWLALLSPFAVPPLAGGLMLLPAAVFWSWPAFHQAVEDFGLLRLTALHISRIAAVPLFFWYGAQGLLPRPFVQHAGWGDLLSGLIALAVIWLWPRGSGYWLAHMFGMADFLFAFFTAMVLTRANLGAMHAINTLPMALIPFFAVGLLGSTHLMSFDLLLHGKARNPNIQQHQTITALTR